MRKITRDAVAAFMEGRPFKRGNTEVYICNGVAFMALHGNEIACNIVDRNVVGVDNCGYFTSTTKERLNGIPGVSIHQHNWVWYLNGRPWDGRTVIIQNPEGQCYGTDRRSELVSGALSV